MLTVWRGSLWVSSNTYWSGRPLIPPAPLISSSARSKPFFHCAPYCAFGPVSGPLTPIRIGSPLAAALDCAAAAVGFDAPPDCAAGLAAPHAAKRTANRVVASKAPLYLIFNRVATAFLLR